MGGAIPPLSQYAFMAWCSVKKHRNSFTFNFIENFGRKTSREVTTPKTWCRWEENIVKNLREIGWEGVDWMHLIQGRDP
jgi:hypothetical protein